jgi:hypothetical protein
MPRLLPYYARLLGWTGVLTVVIIPCGLVGMIAAVAAQKPELAIVVTVLAGGFTAAMVAAFLWRLRPAAEGLRLATVGRPARARIDGMDGDGRHGQHVVPRAEGRIKDSPVNGTSSTVFRPMSDS